MCSLYFIHIVFYRFKFSSNDYDTRFSGLELYSILFNIYLGNNTPLHGYFFNVYVISNFHAGVIPMHIVL